MNKIKLNKKILYVVALLILILMISLIFINTAKKDENPISTYSINQAGQMRNENEISEEVFDEYGNLTHYKYKKVLEDGTIYEKEYNINYTFDNQKRITRVAYDNNYIEIKYNNDNKIYKLINHIKDDENIKRKYEHSFTYNNSTINVSSTKSYISSNVEENYTTYENYTITENTINNDKYLKCILSYNDEPITEISFKSEDKKTDYSNIFSLLNIEFEGYSSFIPTIKNTDFTIEFPIFNSGSIFYQKDLTINSSANLDCYYYYDKDNNILKYEMPNLRKKSFYNEMYFIYENINDKIYYRYSISASKDANIAMFNLIKDKIYLDTNDVVYKIETLENETLTEEQYQKELNKFEKYFEENKQDNSLYNYD